MLNKVYSGMWHWSIYHHMAPKEPDFFLSPANTQQEPRATFFLLKSSTKLNADHWTTVYNLK